MPININNIQVHNIFTLSIQLNRVCTIQKKKKVFLLLNMYNVRNTSILIIVIIKIKK